VASALVELHPDEGVSVVVDNAWIEVKFADNTPLDHKFATKPIKNGGNVTKYG